MVIVAHQIFALQTTLAVLALDLDQTWQIFLVMPPLAEIVNAVSKTYAQITPLFLVVAHQDIKGRAILTLRPVVLALPAVLKIAVIKYALVQAFAPQDRRNLSLVWLYALPQSALEENAVSLRLVRITHVSVLVLKEQDKRVLFALGLLVSLLVVPPLVFVSKLVVSRIVLLDLAHEEKVRHFNADWFALNATVVFVLAIAILVKPVE